MSDLNIGEQILLVPRGTGGLEPMRLDMTEIYQTERRLRDVATATPGTAPELQATYNVAANEIGKYISWVKYEKLRGEKELKLAKARVIIDDLPGHAAKLKESGIKMNEDIRDAYFVKDARCSEIMEKLNAIEAVLALLEAKFWSFIRAHDSVSTTAAKRGMTGVQINATPGQLETTENGFMGKSRY